MKQANWEKRIRRALDLGVPEPSASEVLTLYQRILGVQRTIYEDVSARPSRGPQSGSSWRDQLDIDHALQWLPMILKEVETSGPARLREEAVRIRAAGDAYQRQILSRFLSGNHSDNAELESFFARALLQPCAEVLATQTPLPEGFTGSTCPICGSKPQLAVLRPEGDGGKRHLMCSLCSTEWEFRRVLCPVCGEVEHTKLPRYSAEDPIAVRVEACDTCKSYLKSFDTTVDGLLIPEVDEIATIALDLWAGEHGYHKIQVNLMGF